MRRLLVLAFLLPVGVCAQVMLTRAHPPQVVIAKNPTSPERLAAAELAKHLGEMLGAKIEVKTSSAPGPGSIIVGLAPKWVKDKGLGDEEVLLRTADRRLYLLGGGPRGTIYAVNRFLHRQGVRWWTPWATHIPKKSSLSIPKLDVREKPRFESRDPFWFHAFDRDWARRNNSNSAHARLTEEDGGNLVYAGFVHTFYPLVPPEVHFKTHPEWYSMIGGVRRVEGGQLCTTNPQLRSFIVERVKEWLRAQPQARIVSVSQNDWYGACTCPTCLALDTAEGSNSATMIDLVNFVADQIRGEFPNVAVDTLAYQYTRKAPKTLRPRPNVIVRLCSIECDFSKPLTDPVNASFATDVKDWSRLTNRLYIWNYGTSFANYMLPFPNWNAIGPDLRFFAANGVKGVFEQGAYQSHGASMAELNAWVQAQLLWNPAQDDKALMREFLVGFYGSAAAPIERYMNLMSAVASKQRLSFVANPAAPMYDAGTMIEAERLWQQAESATASQPDQHWRVRIGHLAVRYVFLNRWVQLRKEATKLALNWPLPESRRKVADEWISLATAAGPPGWAPITVINESGLRPQQWIEQFATDPIIPVLPPRRAAAGLPTDLTVPSGSLVVSVQDDKARLYEEGSLCETHPDPLASDGIAVRLPGVHHEWAYQQPMPAEVSAGTWKVYAVVRVEPGADPGAIAFHAGIYSSEGGRALAQIGVTNSQSGTGYRTVLIGTAALDKSCYVWLAPADAGSKAVWVDRMIFVRASS